MALRVSFSGLYKGRLTLNEPRRYGLSYTTFKYGSPTASSPASAPDFSVTVDVSIINTGSVSGSEVVQLYISLPKGHLTHPLSQLRAFQKVRDLAPGKSDEIRFALDKYAVSYWDDLLHKWRADKGTYAIRIASSSDKVESETTFSVDKAFEWSGL